MLAAACLFSLGCHGVSHNPSTLPHLFPFGDIVRTHAKPGGLAYFWNFDRRAHHLEVKPLESTNPVGVQQVFIATVLDEDGNPRRNRRVEWLLEGAGNIVEVDESGFFPGRGYKVDNKYAVTYTDWLEHTISRGNDNPADDFVVKPGQSWCVVSSAVEGDTKLTVYAPEIHNWDRNRIVVTTRWVDALWRMPPPGMSRFGTPHVLATEVFRPSDRQPLAGYLVRYRVIDGPPAVFLPSRTAEVVVRSDLNGLAAATLAQAEAGAGVNHVSVEILRPPDPTAPSGAGITLARGQTEVQWQAPQVGLSNNGPPAVRLGEEAAFTLVVANTGQVATQEVTLRDAIPEGVQYVRSDPPAIVEGNQLIWTLPALPPGASHTATVVFRAARPGTITNSAWVVTRDGLRDERSAATQVTVAGLDVRLTGPETALLGVPIHYEITVSNPGTAPVNDILLNAAFDAGLEHEKKANPIKKTLSVLAPGDSAKVDLTLTPRQAGRQGLRVSATGGGLAAKPAEHAVIVRDAQLRVEMSGPTRRYVNKPASWQIRVGNPNDFPLTNVVVRDLLPPELTFVAASAGGTANGKEVVWTIASLPAGQQQVLELTANAVALTPKAVQVVGAVAQEGLQAKTESAIEINGLPALGIELRDSADPIEVNGTTTYDIEITNRGSLAGTGIEIVAVVPPQLKVIRTRGPTEPRIEGGRVTFPAMATLPVGQKIAYGVEVQAVGSGKPIFQVELRSATLREPVIQQESTTVIQPNAPAGPSGEPPMAGPPGSGA